ALAERLGGANLFVNTTSLGMDDGEAPGIDFSPMHAKGLVTDIVYVPLMTAFLLQAKAQGRGIADGLGMLVVQAVPGFGRWFGRGAEVTEELRAKIVADLEKH